jgi:regulator of sigma E protease
MNLIQNLANLWWYLIVIAVIVLVHEFGHFIVARIFRVRVDIFSFGFGPRLFGLRIGDTEFRCSAIPIGGYVRMADAESDGSRAVTAKPRWQRILIALAGPSINVVLSVGLLAGLFMVRFPQRAITRDPVVEWLDPNGPAAKSGVREGDHIVQIDGIAHPAWEDIELREMADVGRPESVWVRRGDSRLHLFVKPSYDPKRAIGYLGWGQRSAVRIAGVVRGIPADRAGLRSGDILVSVAGRTLNAPAHLQEALAEAAGIPIEITFLHDGQSINTQITAQPAHSGSGGQTSWMIGVSLEPAYGFIKLPARAAIVESVRKNLQMAVLIVEFLDGVFEQRMPARSIDGPIEIAEISGQAARAGAPALLQLVAAISLNLAVFNLLPVPILDGGVILVLLVEASLRHDLGFKVKDAVARAGFAFLVVLTALAIYNDIAKMMPNG